MQKNRSAQMGLFNPRILIAVSLACGGVLLTMLSFAATPVKEKSLAPAKAGRHSTTASGPQPAAPAITGPTTSFSNGITFDHAVWNDPVRMVGEPDIELDDQNGTYVSGPGGSTTQSSWFWKSTDHGMQWHLVGCPLKANCQNGGGDTEIAIARNGDVFASDLQTLACNSTFRSYDRGATWAVSEGCIPATDRQWMAVYDPNSSATGRRVYLSANGQAVGCYVLVSTDNGVTYGPPDPTGNPDAGIGGSCNGRYAINKNNGHLYLPNSAGTKVSLDGGVTWLTRAKPAGVQANLFANITIDTAGNLYQGWINNNRAFVSYSTNEGQTWSTPVQVSTGPTGPNGNNPDLRQMVMPWTVAGDPGRVAIVYYATTDPTPGETGPGSPNALWYPYVAISTNAMEPNPTWTQVQVDEHPMHRGEICDQGTFCAVVLGDRSLADFLDVDIDSDGRLYFAYNEGSDLSLVVPPNNYIAKPINAVIRQRTGPSLYAAKGTLLPQPTPANVAITSASVSGGNLTVNGTQGLPPGNWTTDPAGDAAFPVVPVQSANHPALDILEASVGDNGTNLTVKMKMADLSPTALADAATAGGTPSWMVTWFTPKAGVGPTPNTGVPYYSHWYMKWRGQNVFEYGIVSSINLVALGAPTPKLLTYVPSGTATGSVNGNEVTMSVPLSNLGALVAGDKIDQIQAYANVEHADVTLNDWADQAKSFSYIIGTPASQQHLSDGYVQVSTDNFGSSTLATLDPASNTWTTTIPTTATSGMVCARQVLSKNLYTSVWDDVQAGPVSCTNFNAPMTVVSRKTHGTSIFDIDLPATGPTGVECRVAGSNNTFTLVYTFGSNVTVPGTAVKTLGNAIVGVPVIGPNPNQVTVPLRSVTNAQHVEVNLSGVQAGSLFNNQIARMDVLLADVNASGDVDSSDVFLVRQQTLQTLTGSNFRADINTSGDIDSADVFVARKQTLTSLP